MWPSWIVKALDKKLMIDHAWCFSVPIWLRNLVENDDIAKGPITWRTFNPGVELSPVNRVEIFCDYMDDFNPGVETLYYIRSRHRFPQIKKHLFCFLVINSHYRVCSKDNFSPGLKRLHDKLFNPGLSSTPGLNSALGWKFCQVIARLILIEFCITGRAEISTL
jgi:hypothetical protein